MLKKLLFGLSLVMSPALLQAQNRTCGTMDHLQQLERQYPGTLARHQQVNREIENWRKQAVNLKTNAGVVTIPVVVHVVYRNATQNISQAQIESQIDVLNEDFSRTNADAVNTPAAFKPIAGDMPVRFELAKRDPNGDPTTGITRTQTTATGFGMDDAVKFTSRGGHDIWDRDKYLNIWVCGLGGGILGYAQFPGSGPDRTDGVVIGYNYFGRTGTLSPGFNKGRTATHEVGHWLGLYHIWGDEPGCANDDLVADTPLQKAENFGCPTFPRTNGPGGTCTPSQAGSMFMNYMDYVDDACMNMFTKGQIQRATDALNTQRPTIITSDGDSAVIVKPVDAAVFKIQQPVPNSCDPEVLPRFILKNRGSQPLTSATISVKVDNGQAQTFPWSGNLASFAIETIVLPKIIAPYGDHTLTISVSSPNGTSDNDPANNALSQKFKITEQIDGLALPFSESFESPVFPPEGWSLSNPDNVFTWERTRRAAATGFNSVFVNNFDYEYIGETDELQIPALNLAAYEDPRLSFKVAYSATNFGKDADTLEVLASADCGVTFTSVYKKWGDELASIPLAVGNPFFPDTSQWRTDTVNLKNFATSNSVILKFRNTTGYENNLFLDDINVSGKALGQKPEPGALPFLLFPNPTSGKITVQLTSLSKAAATVIVCNSIGQEILIQKHAPLKGKIYLDLSGKADGIYMLKIISEGKTHFRKLVLNQLTNQ